MGMTVRGRAYLSHTKTQRGQRQAARRFAAAGELENALRADGPRRLLLCAPSLCLCVRLIILPSLQSHRSQKGPGFLTPHWSRGFGPIGLGPVRPVADLRAARFGVGWSEERRVGKGCVSRCRSRWLPCE